MHDEIQEIIRKNLPQEVGEMLRERLEEAGNDRIELERANNTLDGCFEKIRELEAQVEKHRCLDDRYHDLRKQENKLQAKENEFELLHTRKDLDREQQRSEELKEIMGMILRPATVRTALQKTIMGDGGYQYDYNIRDSNGQPVAVPMAQVPHEVTDVTEVTDE
jgi:molecular chaperone GrpE (heat shock protein)